MIRVRMATIIDSGVLIAANWNHLNYDNISTRYEKEDVAIIGGRSP